MTAPSRTPSIVIVGAGFGGLGLAIQLRQAGIHSFTILEKAGRVGGTWRDNTYPGAACDVQSHLYSFSFEPRHDWSRKFGLQAEIQAYMEHCVAKYGLAAHLRFHAEVSAAGFDDGSGEWIIRLNSGETLRSNVLVTATGQLSQPAYPDIPGIDAFAGKAFHSARWDHDHDLTGKRVAVIGTGASAIQFVPRIVPRVKSLHLFQRSAAWVIGKPDRPFKRWEQALFARLPLADRAYRSLIYWKNESRALAFTRFDRLLDLFALEARALAWRHVKDPVKRKKLIPDYRIGCKRILMASDWYPALNESHVEVITTGIARIEKDAVVTTDGSRHEVDALIYGTGFKATQFLSPLRITGRNGLDLNAVWRDGAEAYKGISVAGFPNLFMLYGPNTNLSHSSIIFMLEAQIRYVLLCLQQLRAAQADCMDVKPARQRAYVDALQARLAKSVWASGCSSWYTTARGRNVANWPGFTFTYRHITRRLEPGDYEFFRPAGAPRNATLPAD
ncbi:MAG: flavin-containing monooxygenase [Pseudomonadota bacterium]